MMRGFKQRLIKKTTGSSSSKKKDKEKEKEKESKHATPTRKSSSSSIKSGSEKSNKATGILVSPAATGQKVTLVQVLHPDLLPFQRLRPALQSLARLGTVRVPRTRRRRLLINIRRYPTRLQA